MPLQKWTYMTGKSKSFAQSPHISIPHEPLFYSLFRQLGDITALSSYVHLRYVDISNNYITDLSPLACLTQLLWLKVSKQHLQACPSFSLNTYEH